MRDYWICRPVHYCVRQTDDRQTDGRRHIANMNMSSRSLKTIALYRLWSSPSDKVAWRSVKSSSSAFHESNNASRWDVCRKLRFCQKTCINVKKHAFGRLGGVAIAPPPSLPPWIRPWWALRYLEIQPVKTSDTCIQTCSAKFGFLCIATGEPYT